MCWGLLLCAVCLFSAQRSLQVHRGASAGFLLFGLASILRLVWPPVDALWVPSVLGLPLLVFSFFWLNGDHLTANLTLTLALALAACSPQLTPDTRLLGAHLTSAGAPLAILVISVFTGNSYGLLGSLALGTWGALTFLDTGTPFSTEGAADCMLGTACLALQMALRTPP